MLIHQPAKGSLANGTTCVVSAEGNSGVACCSCGVGSADDLKGVEVAVAVEEVFERRESEYILLVGSRKPPANGIHSSYSKVSTTSCPQQQR